MTNHRHFSRLEQAAFFRATVRKRNLLLALSVLVQLLVLAAIMCLRIEAKEFPGAVKVFDFYLHLAVAQWQVYLWLVIVAGVRIWLSHRGFRDSLEGPGMTTLTSSGDVARRRDGPNQSQASRRAAAPRFGRLTGRQLAAMVNELADQMNVGPVSRIVVSDQPDPNAYTAYLLGVGNVVVLNANVLEILPPAGVRAIVAHEIGHIRRRDSLVHLLADIPHSFIYLIGVLLLWKIGVGVFWFEGWWTLLWRVLFLVLFWSAAMWVLDKLQRLGNLASQQGEHIADAYAAHVCGAEAMVNALLLLGQRSEALFTLARTLQSRPYMQEMEIDEEQLMRVFRRFPTRELDGEKARQTASRLYIESRLEELRETLCVPLSEEQIIHLAAQADRALQQQEKVQQGESDHDEAAAQRAEEEARQSQMEELLINWRRYDWDQSGHLDAEETAALVADLRRHPQKMVFRQFLEPNAKWQSHPTMRRRLLYLYDAFSSSWGLAK